MSAIRNADGGPSCADHPDPGSASAKVFVVFLEAVFVIAVTTMAGVRAADIQFHDIAHSFRASSWLRFKTVVLPASVPFILTGARLGTSRALVGVVIAEFLASNGGIGFYISLNGSLLRTSRVYFGIVLLGILGVLPRGGPGHRETVRAVASGNPIAIGSWPRPIPVAESLR